MKSAKGSKAPKADKAAKQAAKASAKHVGKSDKAAKKAAKAERKATKAESGTRLERAPKPEKPPKSEKVAKAKPKATGGSAGDAADLARGLAGQAGQIAAAAGAILGEVAGLVRQAAEPAAGRIVDMVGRESEPEAEPVGEAVAEPDPEPEAIAEPVPEAALEPTPEPEQEPEPEPEAAAEPAPEPEAVADVELELEPEPEPRAVADEPSDAAADSEQLTAPAASAAESPFVADSQRPEPAAAFDAPEDAEPPTLSVAASAAETAATDDADAATAALLPPFEVQPGARIAAAIDVGATSVHLLVAAVGDHQVVPMLDESVFLGLGDRVSADGRIGSEARAELAAAVAAYVESARRLAADPVTIVGTEPMRRADDAAAAVQEVTDRAHCPFHVVDHDEEGLLTLLGVTGGRPLGASTLVVDIGGGSSEIVVTEPDGTVLAGGLPLGAAQLTRELVHADPPTLHEIDALRARVREAVAQLPDLDPGEIVAVGGTASNLLKLLPATAIDRMLTRRRITVALAMLTVERSQEAAARHLIRPERARILPAGALIVDAILERFNADRLRVSDEGIRSGLLIATTAAGGAWRDRLPRLAGGWESSPLD
jgi:hypothetical protein